MSFSSDLWKGFEILYEQFKLYNNELKHLYLVFHEITQIEKEYSKGMKYICTFSSKMQLGGSLGSALNEFYNELNKIADNHNNYALSLSNKILIPLKERIGKAKEIQSSFLKNEENETNFNQTINQLINFQEKFHLATKELSVAVAECELAKANENIKKSMKNKYLSTQNKKMEIAKKAETEYINQLSEANKHREQFNHETKEILDNLQKQNKQIIDCIQSILIIYSKTIADEINQFSKSNERLQKKYEEIEGEKDIKEFIQANATKVFPFYKFEFIPYKPTNITTVVSENLKEEITCVDKKTIVANVKRFISTELKYTAPKPEQKVSQEFEEIETATNTIWKNGKIDSIKKKIFDLHLTKKSHMNCFIKCLNQFRAHGDFILSEDAYNTLSELFISILNNETYQKDYNVLKNLIILSQTFYKIVKNKKEPKQLIQTAIQGHPIWTNWKTWEEIIKYSIGEQDKITRDNILFNKKVESNKERLKRLNQFAKNTLVSYLCNMILFNIQEDVCSEVRDFICKVYNLDENEIVEHVTECSKANTEEEPETEISKEDIEGKKEDNGNNENKTSDNTRSSTEELKNSDDKKDTRASSTCVNGDTHEKGITQIGNNKNNKEDIPTQQNNIDKEKVEKVPK